MERAELKAWVLGSGVAVECGDFVFLCDPEVSAAERASELMHTLAQAPSHPRSPTNSRGVNRRL